jgi:F0F1-type ATP synthase membrane subunit b/b'
MKNTAFALTLLMSTFVVIARANGAEHGVEAEEAGIPLRSIMWQAANLGALLIAIYFFTRKSIAEVFVARRQDYLSQAEKTKVLLREAENALKDVKSKLSELESGEQKSFESAKKEAALLREGIARDAETAAIKLKRDAELVIAAELQKAKSEINAAILNQAVASASQKLSSGGASTSNQEAGFLKQLEQVKA